MVIGFDWPCCIPSWALVAVRMLLSNIGGKKCKKKSIARLEGEIIIFRSCAFPLNCCGEMDSFKDEKTSPQ